MDDLLAIPSFLRRADPGPISTWPQSSTRTTRTCPTDPKRQPGERITINLTDTCVAGTNKRRLDGYSGGENRIGFGTRQVVVNKIGRKWVYLHYWPGGPGGYRINQRMALDEWERLTEKLND